MANASLPSMDTDMSEEARADHLLGGQCRSIRKGESVLSNGEKEMSAATGSSKASSKTCKQANNFGGRLSKMCMVGLRPALISKVRRPGHCPA